MLTVLATTVLVFLSLLALIWLGTLWAQGYFYDSAVEGLYWRAPATAGAVAIFFFLWMVLEWRRPNSADTLFRFSSEHADEFDRFISVRRNEEGEQEVVYEKHTLPGGKVDFRDDKNTTWARSKSGMMVAIIIEENGEKHRFDAELSPDGKKFAPSEARGIQQSVRYYEQNGRRFIVEDQMGKAISYRRGQLIVNILVNILHVALWFTVLWLLLRFQWPHALLGAAACWLVVSLALLPFMLDRARDAAKKRPAPKSTAALRVRWEQVRERL